MTLAIPAMQHFGGELLQRLKHYRRLKAHDRWPVILSGVYERPECFPEAVSQLNEHGLLTSDTECDAVFARYLDLASSEIVEPLMERARATNIRVFRAGRQTTF